MPACFKFFPERSLIYMRYSGVVTIDDYVSVVEGVTGHPRFSVEYKHLVDLTHLRKVKRDYFRLMLMQARIIDVVARARSDILSVIVAPTDEAMAAAKMILRSWDDLETPVVRRVIPEMSQAASLLGLEAAELGGLIAEFDRAMPPR